MSRSKKRGMGGLILDLVLTIVTGGLWLVWIVIRYLRHNSQSKFVNFRAHFYKKKMGFAHF